MRADARLAALAVSMGVGALHPSRPALLVGLLVVGAGVAGRWFPVVAIGAALVTSGLAQRSLDGLDGLRPTVVEANVTVVSDPAPGLGGLRFDVRMEGRRLEALARGSTEGALRDVLAGEVLTVRGRTAPVDGEAPWLVPRHVSGRLHVLDVLARHPGSPPARLANGVRRTLVAGAEHLPARQRALYTGLVIGDDRAQPADLADDFLGAGLTHLLAVSGQNVAFVLAVGAPVLRRLRLWPRLVVSLGLVAGFALATRFEPSVVRASAMAAVAATVGTAGWPWPRTRVLSVAVAVLLLVDPLLVRSVGFRLSVAAAASIVLLAPHVERALPGPRWLRSPLAVTVAAQLGVAPVLLATFGPLPVASLPANLLAVPVAGFVMAWGLTAGLVAGLVGGPAPPLLHRPTELALGWLEGVAHHAADAPLGQLGAREVLVAAAGLALAAVRPSRPAAGRWLAAGALLAAVVVAQAPAPLRRDLAPGVVAWRSAGVDVIVLSGGRSGGPSGASVLAALRSGGVRTVDALVVADTGVDPAVVRLVALDRPVGVIVVRGSEVGGSVPVLRPPPGSSDLALGAAALRLDVVPDRIVAELVPRGGPGAAR